MNFILRVLCLKKSMPANAPKGPKNASSKSLDSGILLPLFLLLSLSIPKATKLMAFTVSMRICRIV